MAQELERRGGRLLAISVDSPADSKRAVEHERLGFPILADTSRDVVRAYGLLHAGGGIEGSDGVIPAHVLVAPDGTIAWSHVSARVPDRTSPDALMEVIRTRLR